MDLPPLKTDPKYGYFPWWPEDGDAWIHPEDVEIARRMIPSDRVFRREGGAGPFVVLRYGDVRLRVMPKLWQEVAPEGFEIGDRVEVLPRGMKNTACTGTVREMLWDDAAKGLRYRLLVNGQALPDQFEQADLKHVESPQP